MDRAADVPIYIVTRDRLNDLRLLVSWLEAAGHQRIIFLDNASTYPPLLEYLGSTPHEVKWLGRNLGARALWRADLVPAERFLLTDPDVVPADDCPTDLVAHLLGLLERFWLPKVGAGFVLDDLPPHLHEPHPNLQGMSIAEWEHGLVSADRERALGVFDSLVDTTFAVYEASAPFQYQALRTGAPYRVRHLPWYRESLADLAEDDRWYLEHADRTLAHEGTTWELK